MLPSDYKITDLIPQRSPMVMIDRLRYVEEKRAGGSLFIDDSNLFCRDGVFQEAGMLEFIAQTAAAYTGYLQIEGGEDIKLGFIGSVKNVVVYSLPHANSEIQSEITVDSELLGYTIITGRALNKAKVLAECEMRIKREP